MVVFDVRPASGDFTNGGFENGSLSGWQVRYAQNQGNGTFAWQTSPLTNQIPAAAVTAFSQGSYTLNALCDDDGITPGYMARIGHFSDARYVTATRISQTTALTPDDLQGGCGVKVHVHWKAVLSLCTFTSWKTPTLEVELAVNQHPVSTTTRIATGVVQYAFTIPWTYTYQGIVYNTTIDFYEISQDWEAIIPGAAVGDQVSLSATVTGCSFGLHGGMAFIDCARILPIAGPYPSFRNPTVWSTAPEPTLGFLVGDFNGDGRDDLAEPAASGVEVRLSNGAAFAPPTLWAPWFVPPSSVGFLPGDFDGDGDCDLASLSAGTVVTIYPSTPSGGILPQFWGGGGASTLVPVQPDASGDFDGDGADDLLLFDSQTPGILGVMRSNPQTSSFLPFAPWSTLGPSSDSADWYIGDFNGDGRDDIARWSNTGGQVQVALSSGNKFAPATTWGAYAPGGQTITHPFPFTQYGFYVGDFNCDGIDDLLRNATPLSGIELLASSGTGFNAPVSWARSATDLKWLYIGNFDGDSADDVAQWPYGSSAGMVRLSCSECDCLRVKARDGICSTSSQSDQSLPLTVWNLTSNPAQSIPMLALTSDGTYSVPPTLSLHPPLLPGRRKQVSVPITNSPFITPGCTHSIGVDLMDAGALICGDTVPFCVPECDCMQLAVTSWYCDPDGSGDLIVDFFVKNLTGSTVSFIKLSIAGGIATCTPDVFAVALPTGASGSFTTRVSGAPPASVLTILYELMDLGGIVLCDETYIMDMPFCPVSGWCCTIHQGCYPVGDPADCNGVFSTSSSVCNNCFATIPPSDPWATLVPVGDAHVAVENDGDALVFHLDEPGQGGLAIEVPPSRGLGLGWQALPPGYLTADGAGLAIDVYGTLATGPTQIIASLNAADMNDIVMVDADLSPILPSELIVSFLLDGETWHSQPAEAQFTLFTTLWPNGVDVETAVMVAPDAAGLTLRWNNPAEVLLGETIGTCDELRIISTTPGPKVSRLTSACVLASGIDYLVIDRIDASIVDPSYQPGDLNCDGQMDWLDFAVFVDALLDPAAFDDVHGPCDPQNADFNFDGAIDGRDCQALVDIMLQ